MGVNDIVIYSSDVSNELNEEKVHVLSRLSSLSVRFILKVANRIEKPKAREYLLQGACRRLGVLQRCICNVFEIFPPTRETLLSKDELSDIQINLHASFANAYGFFDNLAWVCAFESGAESELKRQNVGLFLKTTQAYLPKTLRDAVQSIEIRHWYSIYAKNFRDTLAHRIPPYVPPFQITSEQLEAYDELEHRIMESMNRGEFGHACELQDDQERIGIISAAVAHSYSDDDASPPVLLHPQMLADGNTVVMIGNAYADNF